MSNKQVDIKEPDKIIRLIFLFFSLIVSPRLVYSQDNNTYSTDERMFHIERSKNRNLVCYDANLIDGKLNVKDPLNIYWVNREKNPGKSNGISIVERQLAYGYKLISADKESCKITLSAYSQRQLTIRKLNGKYVCIITINNEPAVLHSLYVKAHEKNSLNVLYVELHGTGLNSNEKLTERVNNKK